MLSFMILFPVLAAGIILTVANDAARARWVALVTTLVLFAAGVWLWKGFDPAGPSFQFSEYAPLFAPYLSWNLGIDGIALMLIVLSVFLMPLCILASWESVTKRVPEYMAAFLVMESLMVGTFAAPTSRRARPLSRSGARRPSSRREIRRRSCRRSRAATTRRR